MVNGFVGMCYVFRHTNFSECQKNITVDVLLFFSVKNDTNNLVIMFEIIIKTKIHLIKHLQIEGLGAKNDVCPKCDV